MAIGTNLVYDCLLEELVEGSLNSIGVRIMIELVLP